MCFRLCESDCQVNAVHAQCYFIGPRFITACSLLFSLSLFPGVFPVVFLSLHKVCLSPPAPSSFLGII